MLTAELVMVSCYRKIDRKFINLLVTTDVNACSSNNGNCSQICANTNGSFICSCQIGYILNADGRTCNG